MKVKNLSRIVIPVLISFALIVGILTVFMTSGKKTANAELSDVDLQEEYAVGTEITIPDAAFIVDGQQYAAQKTIYYPDGSAYRKDTVVPTEMGYYTVEYSADTPKGYQTEEKKFYVYKLLYQADGVNSSVEYGTPALTPTHQGVIADLSESGKFVYNRIIDLNDLSKTDELISMYITPEKAPSLDFSTITLYLTDIYDSAQYLKIVVNSTGEGYSHGISYVQAGAEFQPTTGLEQNLNKIHRNNKYGFPTDFSFYGANKQGQTNETILFNNKLTFYMDYAEKQLLCPPNSVGGYSLVADFDNPDHFTDLWEGFTTGEVYLSMELSNMQSAQGHLVITDIAGHDLTENKLVDTLDPVITVDTDGYEVLPEAVVNCPYPLFAATANDQYSGELSVSVKVYENYYSSSKTECSVVNGIFTPTHSGKYYLVYTASDWSDRNVEKVFEIECLAKSNPIELTVEDGLVSEGFVGSRISLPDASGQGGSGRVNVGVTVADGNGDPVEVENNAFKPETAGEYTVTYTAADYVSNTAVQTFTVDIAISDKPVFDAEAVLPDLIVAGYEYVLPELTAYDYSGGSVAAVETKITVTDDSGTRELNEDRKVTFDIKQTGGSGDIKIVYTAENANGATVKTYTLKVYNVHTGDGYLDMSKYFVSEKAAFAAEDSYVSFTAPEDATAQFINPLMAEGFNFSFSVDKAKSNLQRVSVYLTDTENSDIALCFSFTRKGSISVFQINNGVEYSISSEFEESQFSINYSNADRQVSAAGSNYITILTDLYGRTFEGFPSGKVNMRIEMSGVSGGEASVLLRTLNSQPLSNAPLDRVAPSISLLGDYVASSEIGKTVTIPAAAAGDVLDPDVNVTLKVTAPDGSVVTSADGVSLNSVDGTRSYEFKPDQFGNYRVSFSSSDSSNRTANFTYIISIDDKQAPVITLSGSNPQTAKLGNTVVIASASVSDNFDTAETIVLRQYLRLPTGKIVQIPGNSFVANLEGEYTVMYFAFDTAGNMTLVENTVTVND